MDLQARDGLLNGPFSRRKLLKGALFAGGGALASAGLSACGGSSSAASSGATGTGQVSAAVKQAIADAEGIKKFSPPGPPIDASKARGAKIFYLGQNLSVPVIREFSDGVSQAAKGAGLEITVFDGQGQQTLYNQGIQQAISEKADCLVIDSIATTSVAAPIAQAHAAGIKIVSASGDIPGQPPSKGGPAPGVDALSGLDFGAGAALEADWVLTDAAGKTINCLVVDFPGTSLATLMVERIKQEFSKYAGSGLKITRQTVDPREWSARLPSITTSAIQGDPNLNYIIPIVDAMALYIVPGVHTANATDRVKVSTLNGTPAVMEMMKAGNVVGADIGSPPTWLGWADVDQALRLLTGMKPLVSENVPLRMFDSTNVNTIDPKGSDDDWYATTSATDGYKKLWGLT